MSKLYHLLRFSILSVLLLCCQKASAQYPAPGAFDGYYKFTSNLKVEDPKYASTFQGTYSFNIETTLYGININKLIIPVIYTDYAQDSGTLTLTTNYGTIGGKNLGFADKDATWTGMGTMNGTLLKWQIEEDGTVTVPDFTIVDFSNRNNIKVVARFSDCSVSIDPDGGPDPEEEEAWKWDFEGKYAFKCKQTEWVYLKDKDDENEIYLKEVKVTDDYILAFTINEYQQIWLFDGYSLLDWHANTIRNRPEIAGDLYHMDVDTYNGIEWMYFTDEDNESTEAKLFGNGRDGDWIQGRRAFTLTHKADGEYGLTDISLWQRTMELMEGYGEVMNRVRVFRTIKKWEKMEWVDPSTVDPDLFTEKPHSEDRAYTPEEDEGDSGIVDPEDPRQPDQPTVDPDQPGEDDPSEDPEDPEITEDPEDPAVDPDQPDQPGEDDPAEPTGPTVDPDDSGVVTVDADKARVRYFTLQGAEVKRPLPGTTVIRIENGKARKMIVVKE